MTLDKADIPASAMARTDRIVEQNRAQNRAEFRDHDYAAQAGVMYDNIRAADVANPPRMFDCLGQDLDMLLSRAESIRQRTADIRARALGNWPEPTHGEPVKSCVDMSALDRIAAICGDIERSLSATAEHLTALERL